MSPERASINTNNKLEPMTPPYRITHSTFNGETLWAVEEYYPEEKEWGNSKNIHNPQGCRG